MLPVDVQITIHDRDYLEDYGNLTSSESEQLKAKVCKGVSWIVYSIEMKQLLEIRKVSEWVNYFNTCK